MAVRKLKIQTPEYVKAFDYAYNLVTTIFHWLFRPPLATFSTTWKKFGGLDELCKAAIQMQTLLYAA